MEELPILDNMYALKIYKSHENSLAIDEVDDGDTANTADQHKKIVVERFLSQNQQINPKHLKFLVKKN